MNDRTILRRGQTYRLGDLLSAEECQRCDVPWPDMAFRSKAIMAAWDGEPRRPPKKGEWYLSGAEILAYKAPNDFLPSMAYHIARLVKVERKEQLIIIPI